MYIHTPSVQKVTAHEYILRNIFSRVRFRDIQLSFKLFLGAKNSLSEDETVTKLRHESHFRRYESFFEAS